MPTNPPFDAPRTSASGHDLTPPSPAELQRLATLLTPEERRVLLHKGTEPAGWVGFLANKKPGVYHYRLCELSLF